MKKIIFYLFASALVFAACNDNKEPKPFVVQPRDTTIKKENLVSTLFLDSTQMEAFIAKDSLSDSLANRMRSFYNSRNYQMAWFDSTGLAEYAHNFLQLQSQYVSFSKDSSIIRPGLRKLQQSLDDNDSVFLADKKTRVNAELILTESFFRYALNAYQGDTALKLADLGWYIPRKKVDLTGLLDSLISRKGKDAAKYEPVNRQYNLLKEYLMKYYEMQKAGEWDTIRITKTSYKLNDKSPAITQIRQRLHALGDLESADTSQVYDTTLRNAVKRFQRRYGLKEDGAIGKGLLKELNRPIEQRIRQLLINMERIRWVPSDLPANYLLVNIPAYQLFVYEDSKLNWKMDVVVGSVAHSTVIFRGDMKFVVFSPYWNVPKSIVKNEVEPGIRKNSNYLEKHNMEWNNGEVRQKPGPKNSLGLVKFLFPNSYNIYLHDTPSKSLFSETNRAFSHGCIRLAEPRKLAEYLLRNDKSWTTEKITKAMNAGKETWVTLNPTIPVYIGYFTAWVDSDGLLNFREDIYDHDKEMEEKLFMAGR